MVTISPCVQTDHACASHPPLQQASPLAMRVKKKELYVNAPLDVEKKAI